MLALLSMRLRFWDLFVVRACLYPFYIANAPHARFLARKAARPLPVFQVPLVVFNFCLQAFAMKIGT